MIKHNLYLYFVDRFIPLDIPLNKVLKLVENRPLDASTMLMPSTLIIHAAAKTLGYVLAESH